MVDSTERTSIGITASFTPHLLVRELLKTVPQDTHVMVADYNQVHQTLMAPSEGFEEMPDRLVVLWRVEDVFGLALTDWIVRGGDHSGLVDDVRRLGALIAQAVTTNALPALVGVPPVPDLAWLDPLDTRTSARLTILHGQLVEAFLDGIGQAPVTLVDIAALVRVHGAERAYDTRNDLMYHQPFTSGFARVLGALLGEAVCAMGKPPPRVLAVDADNTLWGGILGEEGPDGVLIGDSFPGSCFRDLQRGLVYQASNGALVALLSKNNGHDVEELFERRSGDMVLTDEHLAARRVDWNSKADNLRSIAEELNLGLDSFVFIDDSDVELEEVRQRLPGVQLVKVSDEPSEIASLTASLTGFRFATVSKEDRERTAMVQVEADRKAAAAAAPSHEEFLHSLAVTVQVFHPAESQVGRVAQLINKTNQFNLTTVRRDEAEVAKLVSSDGHRVYAAEVSDRFGSYGLVAVAVVVCADDVWEVDTFLMSCRVLMRRVEDAILRCIADDACVAGVTTLRGYYRPTQKNGQVASFYPDRGFQQTGEGRYDATLPLSLTAEHVTVRRDA